MKSKFSIAQTVLLPFFLFLFIFGLGGLSLYAGIAFLSKSDNGGFLLAGFGLVFLAMGIVAVNHYVLILNQIKINVKGISIQGLVKHKAYKWSEIDNIHLTGKGFETFMFTSMPMEAISIETKDGDRETILVKFYSNMDRIRTALHFINIKIRNNEPVTLDCFTPVERRKPAFVKSSSMTKYGGNHLLTLNGIMAHGGLIFIFWIFLFSGGPMGMFGKSMLSAFMILFCYGLYGYQLHYFYLDKEHVVVKNHIWLWRNDTFRLADIREIVFEEPHKISTSLRVITNNYETKLYPAGSIKRKSWSRLSQEFTNLGITVRNEAYFD